MSSLTIDKLLTPSKVTGLNTLIYSARVY